MGEVVLALGSNQGDSARILQGAVDDLASVPGLELDAVSRVFETDPVGGPDQDQYLNAVVLGRTSLSPNELLSATQAIERAWHRVRDVRWGPRTLDVDIVAMGEETVASSDLDVPHPRAHERAFVLIPWIDVAPDAVLAGHGRIEALLARVDTSGVRATALALHLPAGEVRS